MNKKLLFFLFLVGFISSQQALKAQSITLELNTGIKNQMNVTEDPVGTYDIETLGGDPWILTRPLTEAYDPEQVYVISFDYIAPAGLDNLQVFYGAPLDAANRRKDFGSLLPTTEYTSFKAFMKYEVKNWDAFYDRFRLDIGRSAGQNISIKNLQLRAALPDEVIPIDLDLTRRNQISVTENPENTYSFNTLGGDPFIYSEILTTVYDPEKTFVISFDYTSSTGLDDLQIFYGRPTSGARRAQFGSLPVANTTNNFSGLMNINAPSWDSFYDEFRFDFGRMTGLDIEISNLVLREPTNAEKKLLVPKETVEIELDVARTSSGITANEISTGSYILNTSGNDPWIRSKPIDVLYDVEQSYIISFEYKTETAYNELEIFYGPPITGTQKLNAGEIPASSAWTTFTINPRLLVDNFQESDWTDFRFDFGRNESEEKTIEVRNITIRKPTPEELEAEQTSDKFVSRELNQQFLNYLGTDFPNQVSSVKVENENVQISGQVSEVSDDLFLAEIEAHQYGFDLSEFNYVTPLTFEENTFKISVPRFTEKSDHQGDRLYSRWAIVRKTGENSFELTSAARWAGDISAISENNIAEDKASSIKGLDGLTPTTLSNFDDLTDLDIKSMKINLLLNGVFSLNPSSLTHEFNGKTYNINEAFVSNLDSRIKRTTDAGIKNAFVLLIPINIGNEDVNRIFVHPDASLGLYSMANVTSDEGIEYYTAMIDFLADRYSRPDQEFGRLDQWIIHNEVDAHTSWTHAGQKPVELYTEIYDRSMRMVHYTIRKYNPTAKVFASFTKHWNSKPVSDVNFKSKDILDTQVKLIQKEGDYEWNIAWHSYPTNLFDPEVWNDPVAKTQFNFDTPEITPRNLEMIDAYVRQQEVLYNGKKVRTILLSENGFSSNTERSPNANETTQAAALAYFWKKTNKRLPSIENIQLHRWVDNANEGGLLFGLWTVQEGTFDGFDEKKEGWYVWEAAGTSRENVVFEPYKSVIGIENWGEIYESIPTEVTPFTVDMKIQGCDANLEDLLVSFNGELKIPQEDGSLIFYNVASNVAQPYEVRKGDLILASDVLNVNDDLELEIKLEAISSIAAKGISPSEIEIHWESQLTDIEGFVIEVKEEDGNFEELDRVSANTFSYVHDGVTAGDRYLYRIAAVYSEDSFSCYSEVVELLAPFLIVDYKDGDKEKAESNKIRPHLILRNEAENEVDLSRATIRYWFTAENYSPMIFKAEQAGSFDKDLLEGNFIEVNPELAGADYYLELSFGEGAVIPATGTSGEIWTKIEKSEPSAFNELDDYSYAPYQTYQQTYNVTVYWDGELIWGEEPGEASASKDSAQAKAENSSLIAVYPNPAHDFTAIKWANEVTQNGDFTLLDYNRNSYPVSIKAKNGNEITLQFTGMRPGIYILKGTINGEEVTHRLYIQ